MSSRTDLETAQLGSGKWTPSRPGFEVRRESQRDAKIDGTESRVSFPGDSSRVGARPRFEPRSITGFMFQRAHDAPNRCRAAHAAWRGRHDEVQHKSSCDSRAPIRASLES